MPLQNDHVPETRTPPLTGFPRPRGAHTATAHFQVNAASFELPGRLLLDLPTNIAQL
jgi:hypothetical protein